MRRPARQPSGRPARGAALAALAASLVLSSCSGGVDEPDFDFPDQQADVEVDSPRLRELKAELGVEDCRPGAEPGANELPAVTVPCFGGGPDVDLSSLPGPFVLNLWAGWCGPCRDEMPVLEEFHQAYGEQVPVIGMNVRDPNSTSAFEVVRETGVTYPLVTDPDDRTRAQGPFPATPPVPSLYLVAEDGSVSVELGGVESVEELVGLVDEQLGVRL